MSQEIAKEAGGGDYFENALFSRILNPIAYREFVTTFRTPRAFVLLVGPAVITTLLVLLQWPSEGISEPAGHRALKVFGYFGYGLGVVTCLLAPVVPAVSIVKERIKGTLQLLLHSPMSPFSMSLGKLVGSVLPLLLSLTMTLPAAAACYSMGGITLPHHILPLYVLLVLLTVQLSSLSLAISSYGKSIDSTVRLAFGGMLIVVVGVLGPYQIFQGADNPTHVLITDWLRHVSPIPALTEILGHADVGGQGIATNTSSFLRYCIASGICTLVGCVVTASRMHIRIFDEARDSGVMTEDRSTIEQVFRRLVFLVDPQRRSGNIGNWTNPVLMKEFRCRRFGRASWILRLVAVSAVASMTVTYLAATGVQNWSVETIGALLIILQMALILLLAPGMSAGLMATELESRSWTMLRMTPQSSFSIAFGKLLSVAWPMFLVLLATLPGYIVMIYLRPILKQQVLMVVGSLLLATLFSVLVSTAIGSCFRKNTSATVCSYAVLTSLTAITFLIWMGRGAPFGFALVEWALIVNPVSSALALMETKGMEGYEIMPWNWYFLSTTSFLAAVWFWMRIYRLRQPD
ncbi:MAG: ABC transporter [Planctomycetaceae bacterium]